MHVLVLSICALLACSALPATATAIEAANGLPLTASTEADHCAPDLRCEAAHQESISNTSAVYIVRCDVAGLRSGAGSSKNAFCSPAGLRLPWSDATADASLLTIEAAFHGPFVSLPALSAIQADEHDTPYLIVKWDPLEAFTALGPATADQLIIRILCPLTVAGHPLSTSSPVLHTEASLVHGQEQRLRGAAALPSVTSSITKTISITRTPPKSASPSRSPSSTISNSRTPTRSTSWTKTSTRSPTPAKSSSRSRTSSKTVSDSRTPTKTITPTRSSTRSPSSTKSVTASITVTRSITPTVSYSPSISVTTSMSPSVSLSGSTSGSVSASPSASSSMSVSPSISDSLSTTPTPSFSPSATPTISFSPSVTPTISDTVSVTPTTTASVSITPTVSASASSTSTISVSVSITPTVSDSVSITPTISDTTSVTPTITATVSISPTISDSASVTPTTSLTPSPTPTISNTPSATPSPLQVITLPLSSPDPTYVAQGPYLQAVGATSLTIMWRPSSAALTSATVFIGPYLGTYTQSFPGSIAPGMLDVVVSLSGLIPNTRYFYAVCGTAQCAPVNASMTFTTSPTLGSTQPVRIYAIGDMGGGSANTAAVLASAKAFMGATPPNMWLFLGDDAYQAGTDSEYSKNLVQYFASDLPFTPLWTTPGNHDSSSNGAAQSGPYFARFKPPQGGEAGGVPSNTGSYYSFDCGMLHIISLDSVFSARTPGSPMLMWLQSDLTAIDRSKTQWIIAFWHHPAYSKGTHNSDTEIESIQMRSYVLPILEQGGVDIVLNGHTHAYERSYLVNGSYGFASSFNSSVNILQSSLGGGVLGGVPYVKPGGVTSFNGTVAVTMGGGSHLESATFGYTHPAIVPFPSTGMRGLAALGSTVLDFTHILINGTVADSFIINKV